MTRIAMFDPTDAPIADLDIDQCDVLDMREELNGEHSLTITTTQSVDHETRLVHVDGTGKVREWVIDEPEDSHTLSDGHLHIYGATWSMQYDLDQKSGGERWASSEEGTHEPVLPAVALGIALSAQDRWEVGNVTITTPGACSFYDGQVWDYLGKLLDTFGGEMEPRIVVRNGRIVHRYVDWLAHVGTTKVTRRFDFGEDCDSISRIPQAGVRYSRVRPRGGSATTDSDGVDYSDRCGIEELSAEDMAEMEGWSLVSGTTYECGDLRFTLGNDYIEDMAAAANFDHGNHPTKVVCYSVQKLRSGSYDDTELFMLASEDVTNHTRPTVSYEASVEQYAEVGMDVHGVALGDEVHIVDHAFGPTPLRIEARVVEVVTNLLDPADAQLTIGKPLETLATSFSSLRAYAENGIETILSGGTLVYVESLLDSINSELNTVGGWKYEVAGHGTYIFDHEVTDPTVGAEASRAIHLGGGFIRFANTKTQAGDWNWTNVITADGYLGLAATIARLTTGFIGSATSGNFWDLDTGEFRMAAALTTINDQTLPRYINENLGLDQTQTFNYLTNNGALQGLYMSNGNLYVNASYIQTGTLSANLIKTGTLLVQKNGKTMLSANCDTGDVSIDADSISLQAGTLSAVVSSMQSTYGTCSTAGSTQVKVVTLADFLPYVGFTVTVTFSYANTAASPSLKVQNTGGAKYSQGPIWVNGAAMTSEDYWTAGGVLTFVWDGSHWRVADGFTMSKIKVLKDSIALSVTGGLGSTASIVLSVGGESTTKTMNLSNVRSAFANDKSAITISAGTVTFNSNTFVVNSDYFKVSANGTITATAGSIGGMTIDSSSIYNSRVALDSEGVKLRWSSVNCGFLGCYSGTYDVHIDLYQNAHKFCLSEYASPGWLTNRIVYCHSSSDGYVSGRLYLMADMYCNNFTMNEVWLNPKNSGAVNGVNATIHFVQILKTDDNGVITNWGSDAYLKFENGLVTDISYYG